MRHGLCIRTVHNAGVSAPEFQLVPPAYPHNYAKNVQIFYTLADAPAQNLRFSLACQFYKS